MPKPKNDHIEKTAKLIFKNSRNTINTYSKTYSGASQIYTKSLILRLKQNIPNAEYYQENGRVKRDLSIETDICILRGYYKKRRNRFINRGTVSTKSKYSVNRTEIDTIDEFKYDSSACGDSKGSVKLKNAHFNVNLTSFVLRNLKKLLNDWVKKYLLDSDETNEKIETVLDSILHKLDVQIKDTVSSLTYTVDIEVIDQEQNQISHHIKSQAAKHRQRQGSLSVPLLGKSFRILSTLSVPKNINRPKTSKCSWSQLNKIRHKKILLSNNGSSKYLFTYSSLNFLTLPTNCLTKRCATYQQDIPRKNKYQQKCLVTPENFDSFTANSAFDTIPSIYKNIYKELRHKGLHDSRTSDRSKKNVHEQNNSEPLASIDFKNQSCHFLKNKQIQETEQTSSLIKASVDKKLKKVTRRRKKSISSKHKKFTYYFRKSKTHTQRKIDLLYHFQSIFEMISSQKGGDVKLDIHVNVFPLSDSKTGKDAVNTCEYSYPLISANMNTPVNPNTVYGDSVHHENNIIPLLDGAVSQAKYIMNGETSTGSSGNNNPKDNKASNYIDENTEIAQELSEIKMIIKSLASTMEKFFNEHITKRSKNKDISSSHKDNTKEYLVENLAKPSIGVQFSNRFVQDDDDSGIKLKKDPKKKHTEYNPCLIKRSTSYNIIDSESILKVTDLTSAVKGETNARSRVDNALTCSLPKTKSLFEVSCAKCDEKSSAIHYDDLMKQEYIYNVCERKHRPYSPDKDTFQHVKPPFDEGDTKVEEKLERTQSVKSVNRGDNEKCSSTIFIDIETKTHGKKITIRPRTGIRFCEGCCYCILLWIPVLVILWLFHEYVLKHYLPEDFSLRRLLRSKRDYINDTYLRLTLADLGF
ncbi:uncharacterized protein LOC123878096 isoform X1 [Maniola jurtina]|uniref:uncharacterized protein LOC123878096 isoform X1 n=1 Tax=Maniola jurtina TaxID=191418 RepID=UPI001E688A5C|nr:uncharacterized protein LOC123878096 isoform X1 [Maniola jurtina]XP_045781114.1 uncharacterized protein LOC123878096 isoform X1 [Maniola jurtina]XP_045781115.1 uncharacterized protein LOC123878096 isoform X1 [Maniola jurtina]